MVHHLDLMPTKLLFQYRSRLDAYHRLPAPMPTPYISRQSYSASVPRMPAARLQHTRALASEFCLILPNFAINPKAWLGPKLVVQRQRIEGKGRMAFIFNLN